MIERRELHLTPDAPWAGPAAYTERDAPYFHGRGAETVELHRLIRAEPVCVLYALSGLGKTSLLQAGVFPRLRAEGWLPVRIRLDHRDLDDDDRPLPSLPAQVLDLIAQAAHAQGCTVPAWDREHDTLAAALHERGERLWGLSEDEPVTPVLVFDQFEECWTLPGVQADPASTARATRLEEDGKTDDARQLREQAFAQAKARARARSEALLAAIAALTDWQPAAGSRLQPAPVRVVFSLREDQLAPLDALRPLFPNLRRARLRLLPFSATQAMEVVTGIAAPSVPPAQTDPFAPPAPTPNPAGSAPNANGSAAKAEASVSNPEASVANPDASAPNPEASAPNPEASAPNPEGSVANPEAFATNPEGFAANPDGSKSLPRPDGASPPADAPNSPPIPGLSSASSIRHSAFVIRHSSLLSPSAADAIVSTFASADPDRPSADPALLSIFCWRLNEDRRARLADDPEATITAARVTALRGEFVRQFYDAAFAQLSDAQGQAARRFVETDLIDAAGFRTSAGFEHAQKKYGVQPASLDTLVDARLLHPVDRSGGHRHVELVHDRIGEEALRQRTAREEAEAKAQADAAQAQAAEEKTRLQRDLARARRRALVLTALTVLALAAMIFALIMQQRATRAQAAAEASEQHAIDARHEAEAATEAAETEKTRADQAKDKALAAKKSADELIRFMQYDLRDTLGKVGRLDMMKSINDRVSEYHKNHPPDAEDISSESNRAAMLQNRGDIFSSQGDKQHALEEHLKSLEIFKRLADRRPANTTIRRNLANSYFLVSMCYSKLGDKSSASQHVDLGLQIAEELVRTHPNALEYQYELAVGYELIGDAHHSAAEDEAALESYQKGVAIRERLAQQDPGNAFWQSGLSDSYDRIGNAQAAAGDGKAALELYQKSLAIRERLAQQDPGNADWQRDLSVSRYKLSQTHEKLGDAASALQHAEAALKISEKLAALDPTNATWQDDVKKSRAWVEQLRAKK